MNRKQFLQSAGRWSLFGGLAAISGVLLAKRKVSSTCEVNPLCDGCREFSICSKDQALKKRLDERKQKG